jgi:hypothetical protein
MANKKLLVFVSSTYRDLIEERQAAVQAILKAGHIPAGMELFTSGDKSQLETIYHWIDQSDVYMLILGARYGSLEPESQVSYTELEFNYAKAQGKAVFSVVITEAAIEQKARLLGTSSFEKENPKQLAQFRSRVLSSVSSFFDDLKDIKLCVYESLGNYALDSSLTGWVSGRDIVDSSSMVKELEALRSENASLKAKLTSQSLTTDRSEDDSEMARLVKILRSIEVIIPSGISSSREETSIPLLDLFINNKDILVAGVTNATGSGEVASFYYHSVFPKLQVHGLAENEKVVGVRYRRSFVNKKGHKLLAWIESTLIEGEKGGLDPG